MKRSALIWACIFAVVLLLGLWMGGVERSFNLDLLHPARIQAYGWPAFLLYAVLLVVLGGIGVPPVVLILPAAAVWSVNIALPLAWGGGLGASWLGFTLSRHFFRETVSSRIPDRIARYEHRLETHGFSTVLVMRLLFYLFPPINWMLGISAISQRTFLLASGLGMLPWTLAYVFTGRGILVLLEWMSPVQMLLALSFAVVGLVLWWRWAMVLPENRKN
jgi:uncharacterized membrane protein YdjX (TVP38/TMEM64 family)